MSERDGIRMLSTRLVCQRVSGLVAWVSPIGVFGKHVIMGHLAARKPRFLSPSWEHLNRSERIPNAVRDRFRNRA